jgi:hypothetical protein
MTATLTAGLPLLLGVLGVLVGARRAPHLYDPQGYCRRCDRQTRRVIREGLERLISTGEKAQ